MVQEQKNLTIHPGKSEVMIMAHNTLCGPFKPVMPGNKALDFVTVTRWLGVVIDNYHGTVTLNQFTNHLTRK